MFYCQETEKQFFFYINNKHIYIYIYVYIHRTKHEIPRVAIVTYRLSIYQFINTNETNKISYFYHGKKYKCEYSIFNL